MNLSEVTDLAISDLLNKDVILPSQYKSTFDKHAQMNNVLLNDDAYVANHNEASIKEANELLKTANSSISKLSDSTKDAQKAILDGDHEKLLVVSDEVSKLRQEMEVLKARVYKDPLTGMKNRLWITDVYLRGEESFQENGAIIFIDLDHFKQINDTYGHNVGDKVLIYISRYLAKEFPNLNLVRFAGDEFILIGESHFSPQELSDQFEAARVELTQKKVKATNGDILHMDFSFGIVFFEMDEPFKPIVEKADQLMYENKQSRR
jgi:diguanylate cyclase